MPAPQIDPGFWRGRRVLMTGVTGFKGAWLALWLDRLGAEVTGFGGRVPPAPGSLFAEARVGEVLAAHPPGDVRVAAEVDEAVRAARPEVVFHLAAIANVRLGLRDPASVYATNVMGTVHVLDAVGRLAPDVRAVVSVTSDKVYEDRAWPWPYREADALGGRDPYAASKACQELVTASFRDALLGPRGVSVATVRAGNVVGGGDRVPDRLVPDFVRAATAGERLHVRAPDAVRPWQHVLDPLHGYLLLAQALCGDGAGPLCTALNFGPHDADRRPVRWIVERLREGWPEEVEVSYGDGEAQEAATVRLDSSRARALLGWTPRWGLAEALEAAVDWYARTRDGEDGRAICEAQIDAFCRPGDATVTPVAGEPPTPRAPRPGPQ